MITINVDSTLEDADWPKQTDDTLETLFALTETRASGGQFAKGGGRVPAKGGSDAAWEAEHGQPRPVGDGDCHAVAGQYVLDHNDGKHVLAQGVPTGQGAIAGTKFDHSWVERTEADGSVTVVEKSNGNDLELPAPVYYAIGRIDKSSVQRFTPEQILDKIDETGVWGPWD